MPKNNRKLKKLLNFGGVKGGRPRSVVIEAEVNLLNDPAIQPDPDFLSDLSQSTIIAKTFENVLDGSADHDDVVHVDDSAIEPDSDFYNVPSQQQRQRVHSQFRIPVLTYDPTYRSYVIVEEFDESKHGKFGNLFNNYVVSWLNDCDVPANNNECIAHDELCQSTVSYTKTGDIFTAACKLAAAKRFTPAEAAERRLRSVDNPFFTGSLSIIEYKESGHTLMPQSAFSLPLWSTHKEIAANIQLYIRPLTGSILSEHGLMAAGFLNGCHDEIQSAVWTTFPSWPNINQHHFQYE